MAGSISYKYEEPTNQTNSMRCRAMRSRINGAHSFCASNTGRWWIAHALSANHSVVSPWQAISGTVVITTMRQPLRFKDRQIWLTTASPPPMLKNGMATRIAGLDAVMESFRINVGRRVLQVRYVRIAAWMDDSAAPLVSVLMITFNQERYIREAVESVLRQ